MKSLRYSVIHLAIVLGLVVLTTSQSVDYKNYIFKEVPDGLGYPPLDREGTAYGNVGGRRIYFAGGVNTLYPSSSSFTAFTDIYTYDTELNTFTRAQTTLPGPSYFGQGMVLGKKLFIYSGRNNTSGSQSANTYFPDMYVVDFSQSITNPTVNTLRLTPPIAPRQYSSGFLNRDGLYFVFGGVNGPAGDKPVPSSEVFVVIDTNNGLTQTLPCDTANCPAESVTNPVVFMNKAENRLYVYSGMKSDSLSFDNTLLYIYDIPSKTWLPPWTVPRSADCVWNGWAVNGDVSRMLLIGGDAGATGSHVNSWVWDLTTDPPTFITLNAKLPVRSESAMVGIDQDGVAWVYSGAIYATSSSPIALQYNHGVLKFVPNNEPSTEYSECMFPEVCTEFDLMKIDTGHVLLGLFLSLCAGLGTTAGALITFLPGAGEGNIWFVGGLGIAGGVMLWISLRELFPTSESYFCCDYSQHYITATTISFVVGILLGIILDFAVQRLAKIEGQNETVRKYLCCKWHSDYEEIADPTGHEMDERKRLYEDYGDEAATTMEMMSLESGAPSERMTKMGVVTAIAVAIHNFPEGVATFMATLASPPLGVAVAVAICSHNIPEGFAIALPLNVGTGNKMRALIYTFFSGMAEPLGALAAWVIFSRFIGPWLFGASFGVVAGLITYIGLREIIPVAHKFDPTDKFSTFFVLLGILLMIVTTIVFVGF